MAFKCQEDIGVSTNFLKRLQDWCKYRIEPDQLDSDSSNRNGKIDITKLTLGCQDEKGLICSGSLRKLPCYEVLLNSCLSIIDLPPVLITEILNFLDPKELGIVSCVSMSLHKLASEHRLWKEFYCERWGLPAVPGLGGPDNLDEKTWKELFVEREFRSRSFLGRYSIDILYGHSEAVRTVFLLASANLIFTSGYDSVVRMWDMEEGLSIGLSRPLGCTIRALAADSKLLIAGGTDGFIHCWRAVEGLPHLFDLKGFEKENTEFRLWEHEGPITSLALNMTKIYSGSWDMSVRIWDRTSMKCVKVLRHTDWVWSLAPHDDTVASTSGPDVYIWDTSSSVPLAIIGGVHAGNTYSLARSHTGEFLFTGGEDGAIKMFEINKNCSEANVILVAKWMPHSGPVFSLAFEFPWLVSASGDGKLALIDVRKLLKTSRRALVKRFSRKNYNNQNIIEPPQRMLHGFGCNLFSVDVGADRIICGGEEGVVRIWNFTQALEIESRVRALKGVRLENRMRRRRLQLEMNCKSGRSDRCAVAAQKNPINGDRRRTWHNNRGVRGKAKA